MDINQKMLSVLKELVENCKGIDHNIEYCLRTSECDDAESPEECTYCTALSPCRECCCGATQTHEIVLRAIQVIQEASQSS